MPHLEDDPHQIENVINSICVVCFLWFFVANAAPAIRVVDEQGNEIRDRYYKIGSKIDLTCQVAIEFITKNATTTTESKFSLLQRQIDIQPTPPPTLFPPISAFDVRDNEIDVSERATLRVAVNDSLFHRIKWTKDGDSVSKEAIFNLRWATDQSFATIFIASEIDQKFIENSQMTINENIHSPLMNLLFILKKKCTNSSTGGWIISRLSILSAERQHSGLYACSIINSTSATVDVQILNGT